MRVLFFPVLVVVAPCAPAQHCGYDYTSIIVVHPHVSGDTAVIKGLRITLLDSNNLPLVENGRPWYLFRPNDDPEACGRIMHGSRRGEHRCFPFAKDNYVLVVPRGLRTETLRVLIQDDDPGHFVDKHQERWQAGWAQQVVSLTAFDSYPLCGTYDKAVYPERHAHLAYRPVDVVLERR